jgi:hypothetical protein
MGFYLLSGAGWIFYGGVDIFYWGIEIFYTETERAKENPGCLWAGGANYSRAVGTVNTAGHGRSSMK